MAMMRPTEEQVAFCQTCSGICFLGGLATTLTISILWMNLQDKADTYNAEMTSSITDVDSILPYDKCGGIFEVN